MIQSPSFHQYDLIYMLHIPILIFAPSQLILLLGEIMFHCPPSIIEVLSTILAQIPQFLRS